MAALRSVPALVWAMAAAGAGARLVVAFATFGSLSDIGASSAMYLALSDGDPFDAYGQLGTQPVPAWPYPPGFLPWVVAAGELAQLLPGGFHGWLHVAPIAADAVLAVLLYALLRGRGERVALAGAAMVAFGPLFALVSGYAFQIDAVAVIPALLATLLWDRRREAGQRALAAGLLVGLAATIKTPLGLVVFAMLPSARSGREAIALTGSAVALPLVTLAPFLLADPEGTLRQLSGHTGVAGIGMLSAVLYPGMTRSWLTQEGIDLEAVLALEPVAGWLLAAVIAAVLLVGRRSRAGSVELAIVLWLALWAFGSGFFFHYLLWGVPFLIACGRLWEAALVQTLGFVPRLLLELGPQSPAMATAYYVWVTAFFAITVMMLARSALRAGDL